MKKTKALFSGTSQCPGIREESMASMLLSSPPAVGPTWNLTQARSTGEAAARAGGALNTRTYG